MKLTFFDLLTCKYSILLNRKLAKEHTDKDFWVSERLFYVLKKIDKIKDKNKRQKIRDNNKYNKR